MKINGMPNGLIPKNQPLDSNHKAKAKESEDTRPKSDKLDISLQAHKLHDHEELLQIAKSKLNSISDIRQERVEDVKGRLASKYYDQDQVISDIAGKMAKSEELADLLASENKQASQLDDKDLKKLAIIFNRIDRSFYDKEAVLKSVADKLKTNPSDDSKE